MILTTNLRNALICFSEIMISEGSFGSLVMQCTKLGLVLGESAGRLGGLAPRATPGPLAIDLDFQ